eukprot:TRINITY_DN2081_c4_g1_i1.p1 TRINITY_DN2081_c4_g1~~TRINITY_DN2081_c4_g1_i1.p1  ORF type:complete len:175 (-),score=59.81 TRINITY_DN2081_c4_g1_i1:86-610(-)
MDLGILEIILMILIFFMVILLIKTIVSIYTTPSPANIKKQAFKKPEPKPLVNYTLEELAEYDGTDENKPILLALDGKVYDVTRGAAFYSKDGPYGIFAGHDASLALALHEVDAKHLNQPIDNLTNGQKHTIYEWEERFSMKYDHVGNIVLSHETPGALQEESSQEKPIEDKKED